MSLHLGIIGPGRIAHNCFAPALLEATGGQLWSVLSRDISRATAFAERFKAQSANPAYNDVDQMLSDPELHAVIITTPDNLHAEMAVRALRAGKHVLVEKPMCVDSESARELLREADSAKRCLAVGYSNRWNAAHREVRKRLLNGYVGRIHHMRTLFTWLAADGDGWRATPELGRWWSMAAAGTHCLDLIRWMMLPTCGEISEVVPMLATGIWNRPHDESALVNFRFESGATAEFTSSVLFKSPSRVEIYGDKGFVICEGTINWEGTGTLTSHEGPIAFPVTNPFVKQLENFIESINNDTPPEVGGLEAARNIELLEEAAQLSGFPCYARSSSAKLDS